MGITSARRHPLMLGEQPLLTLDEDMDNSGSADDTYLTEEQQATRFMSRWQEKVESFYHDPEKTAKMAVIWDGVVRMANLCIAGGMAINGVSALHSDILRHDVFRDACRMEPEKFKNVTNGIDHRRWLAQINPRLDELVRALAGGE